MGGAIGTPLLFTTFLLATALVCTIKKNGKTSEKKNNSLATTANTQMDDSLFMAETSYDDVVSSGLVESSSLPHLYDNESMYINAAYGGYIRLIA